MEKQQKPGRNFKYGEPTKSVTFRIPVSKVATIKQMIASYLIGKLLPDLTPEQAERLAVAARFEITKEPVSPYVWFFWQGYKYAQDSINLKDK